MEDQFSDEQHLYLQQSSARFSDRYQDKFKPQSIWIDQCAVPHKITSTSQIQIMDSFQENNNQEQLPQFNLNENKIANSTLQQNHTMTHIATSKRIKHIISQNKLLKKVKDKFLQIGYILPKENIGNIQAFLEESYLGDLKKEFRLNNILLEPIKNFFPIFSPTSKFILIWQIFRIIQMMFLLWWVPFKIAFNPQPNSEISSLEQVLVYFMIIDLLIKLNVGIIDQGQIIKDRWFILTYYLKYELYEDIIYIITLIIIIGENPINAVIIKELIVLTQFSLNFFKLKKKIKTYEETLTTQSTFIELVNLSQLIIVIFYFAHFMACVWFYVGIRSLDEFEESWIIKYQLLYAPISYRYCYSFYWATATMVTVGYGDITGQNLYEILCSIILMFLASGIFAFSINSIGMIFTNLDSQQQGYKRTLLLINHYMQFNEVQHSLQSRIRNYLKYIFEQENLDNKNEIQNHLNQLSNNLRSELLQDVQIRVLQSSQFFKQNFSENTIRAIAQKVKFQQCTPKELIYHQNNNDDNSIYIIQKGEIKLIEDNSGKLLKVCKKGDCFGEVEFLTDTIRHCSAHSSTFTQLYKISRAEFLELIKDDVQDFQKFHMLKDSLLFKLECNFSPCYACKQDHFIHDCNYLFYKPDIEFLIKKSLFYSNQERQTFKRKEKRFFNIFQKSLDIDDSIEQTQKGVSPSKSHSEFSSSGSEHNKSAEHQRESLAKLPIANYKSRKSSSKNQQTSQEDICAPSTKRQSNRQSIRIQDLETPLSAKKRGSLQSQFVLDQKQTILQQMLPPIKEVDARRENKEYNNSKSFHQLDELTKEQYFDDQLDLVFSFQNYFTKNNIENVIQNYEKFLKQLRHKKISEVKSQYRFYQIKKTTKSKIGKGKKNQASTNSIVIRDFNF